MRPYTPGSLYCPMGLSMRFFAIRTHSPEKDIVSGECKSMVVFDVFLQTGDIVHIHIKKPPAFFALHMAMIMTEMVKPVSATGNFYFSDFAHFGKYIQIPVNGRPAQIRMLLDDCAVNFVCSGVALQLVYGFKNQRPLNCIAFYHYLAHTNMVSLLILYINKE